MNTWKYILTPASTGTPVTLTYLPSGWKDKTISFMRNSFYGSVLRSLSLNLKFVCEGKTIIVNEYDTLGINAVVGVQIQKLNRMTDTYSDYYTGIVDFSKIKITRDYCEVPIIDNNVLAKFKAREDVKSQLNKLKTFDDVSITDFAEGVAWSGQISGVEIRQQSTLTGGSKSIAATENFNFVNDYFPCTQAFTINEIGEDDAKIPDNTTFILFTNNGTDDVDIEYTISLKIAGTITMSGAGISDATIRVKAIVTENATAFNIINFQELSLANTDVVDLTGANALTGSKTNTATIPAGESLYFKVQIEGIEVGPSGAAVIALATSLVNIDLQKITPAAAISTNDFIFAHEALQRLLQLATGEDAALDAPLIGRTDTDIPYTSDGEFGLLTMLNGFMVRGFPLTNYCASTSIRDFIKSLQAIAPVGLWYDETLNKWFLKNIDEFYHNNEIIALGEVKDFERYVDDSLYFNEIMAGYREKITYEEINGLQNQNTSVKFVNNVSPIKNSLDLQSIYRGDDYGIEFARKKPYSYNGTEDTRYDSDIWWLTFMRDGVGFRTIAGYDNFDIITGVLSPDTRLNLDITPKRNLLRHGSQVVVPLWKQTTAATKYAEGQMNLVFESKKASDINPINEVSDIPFAELPEPLYDPEVYNFTAPVTSDQIAQLIADPHGYVTFQYLGVLYYGYVLEVSTEPFGRKGNWTLIKANLHRDMEIITNSIAPLTPLTDNSLDLIIW